MNYGLIRKAALTVLVLFYSGYLHAEPTTIRYSDNWTYSTKPYGSIGLLPVNASIITADKNGNKVVLEEEASSVASRIASSIKSQIEDKNYRIEPVAAGKPVSEEKTSNTFKEIRVGAPLKKDEAKITDTFFDLESLALSKEASHDAYLYVDYIAYRKPSLLKNTENVLKLAMGVGISMLVAGGSRSPAAQGNAMLPETLTEISELKIMVIDSKSGEVLWVNSDLGRSYGTAFGKGSRTIDVSKLVSNTLENLRKAKSEFPVKVPADYEGEGTIYVKVMSAERPKLECALNDVLIRVVRESGKSKGLAITDNPEEDRVLELYIESIRKGKFGTAKTKSTISGKLYFKQQLIGNFRSAENINVPEGYNKLCKRLEASLKRSMPATIELIGNPSWNPLIVVPN